MERAFCNGEPRAGQGGRKPACSCSTAADTLPATTASYHARPSTAEPKQALHTQALSLSRDPFGHLPTNLSLQWKVRKMDHLPPALLRSGPAQPRWKPLLCSPNTRRAWQALRLVPSHTGLRLPRGHQAGSLAAQAAPSSALLLNAAYKEARRQAGRRPRPGNSSRAPGAETGRGRWSRPVIYGFPLGSQHHMPFSGQSSVT